MPTVFDNYQTAHVWAQQTQHEGRSNNGNFYFQGRSIYSYGTHYCAGYALPDFDGGFLYLWNADSSSVTTNGKHLPAVRRAIPGRGVGVPGLTEFKHWLDMHARTDDSKAARWKRARVSIMRDLPKCWPGESGAALILAAMGARDAGAMAATMAKKVAKAERVAKAKQEKRQRDVWAADAKALASKTPRDVQASISHTLGQWSRAEDGIEQLARQGRQANRAAKEAKARGWTQIAATCRDHYKAIRAAVKQGEERAAHAYRNRNKRNAIEAFRDAVDNLKRAKEAAPTTDAKPYNVAANLYRYGQEVARAAAALSRHVPLSEVTLARLASVQEAARVFADEQEAKAASLKAQEIKEAIQEWRAGGNPSAASYFDSPHGGAAVRAVGIERGDSGEIIGGTLETSHRAKVPLVAAIRVFQFLKLCRDKAATDSTFDGWRANGKRLHVGHFRVDSVTPRGDFVAGCHRIKWQEVESLARALNVLDLPPENTTTETV